ncbi:MAG: ATP-binding protein [Smithella sp.]|nr:ATP-binding protein [Smithella sp.]
MVDMTSELTLRSLSSTDCIIKTKAIHQLSAELLDLLSTSTCGAIIYGRARIGKTRAMISVADSIRDKYGENFPVIMWDITDHAITEKNFYTTLLMAMGFEQIPSSSTALALKERVLNTLSIMAYETPFKKVVIMLDEAWKFTEKDFSWLMDLYNNLNHKDILLTCFLFGTHELKDIKSEFKLRGKDQIIGRFMIKEYQFYGMKEAKELMLCLVFMDNMPIKCASGNSSIMINDFFFPDRGEAKFINLASDYWNAFMNVRRECKIAAEDIPMKYFIDSFIILLQKYGRFGADRVAFPTYQELVICIKESGYGESDDEYENTRSKRKKQA